MTNATASLPEGSVIRKVSGPRHCRCDGGLRLSRKADIDAAAIRALLHRVFGNSMPVTFQRTPDGVSTQVYRIQRGRAVFYLRIAEEPDENLETEAELHRRLRGLGVTVADIVHVEHFNADIGRSTMITTEIRGAPAADISDPALAASIVEQAGADLAIINQIPVDGFGFRPPTRPTLAATGRVSALRELPNFVSPAALARPAGIVIRRCRPNRLRRSPRT